MARIANFCEKAGFVQLICTTVFKKTTSTNYYQKTKTRKAYKEKT